MRTIQLHSTNNFLVSLTVVGALFAFVVGCTGNNSNPIGSFLGSGAGDPYCPGWFSWSECQYMYDIASQLLGSSSEICQTAGGLFWERMSNELVGFNYDPDCGLGPGGILATTNTRTGNSWYCEFLWGDFENMVETMAHEELELLGFTNENAEGYAQMCYWLLEN